MKIDVHIEIVEFGARFYDEANPDETKTFTKTFDTVEEVYEFQKTVFHLMIEGDRSPEAQTFIQNYLGDGKDGYIKGIRSVSAAYEGKEDK